jgi:hypothetical protein
MMADIVNGAEESVGQGQRVADFVFANKEENGVGYLNLFDSSPLARIIHEGSSREQAKGVSVGVDER